MPEEIIYKAENGIKLFFRTFLFGTLLILGVYFWSSYQLIFSLFILISLYQIFFFKYSTMIVYNDKISYYNKTLLKKKGDHIILNYRDLYQLQFSPSEIELSELQRNVFFAFLSPSKTTEIVAIFTNNSSTSYYWGGNINEVQIACEKANEIIKREFNRPKF